VDRELSANTQSGDKYSRPFEKGDNKGLVRAETSTKMAQADKSVREQIGERN
jgi:hypothetical protein